MAEHEEEPVTPFSTRISALMIAAMALVVLVSCGGGEKPAPAVEASVTHHESVTVDWEDDLPAALARARSEGKPVLVNFYADWCVWCKRLESTTLRDAQVATMLRDKVVPLSLDVEGSGRELSNEFRVDGLPTILMLDPDGHEIGRIPGYTPPSGFLQRVEGIITQS